MFKPSEYVMGGALNQKTIFYKDINNNGILDSQDTIVAQYSNAASNPELLDRMKKESNTTGTGITYVKNEYLVGTKQVPLAEYNQKLFLSTSIDIFSICILLFLAWYVLFPKRTKE